MMLEDMTQAGINIGILHNILNLLCDFSGASAIGFDRESFLMCHALSLLGLVIAKQGVFEAGPSMVVQSFVSVSCWFCKSYWVNSLPGSGESIFPFSG